MMILRSNIALGGGNGADRLLDGSDRGDRVNRGAHAADALRKSPGVARITAAQDYFNAAKHGRGRPRFGDRSTLDLGFDAQVAFDASDRIDNDVGHCLTSDPPSSDVVLPL